MSDAVWDAPFPEDDCWYQFFKQAMIVWYELQNMPPKEKPADEVRD
jgi:hypothetical protein